MSQESTTLIIPFSLGAAAKYDPHVFPLTYHDPSGSDFSKGSLLLSATLDEMEKISQLGIVLAQSSHSEPLYNARIKYEALVVIPYVHYYLVLMLLQPCSKEGETA